MKQRAPNTNQRTMKQSHDAPREVAKSGDSNEQQVMHAIKRHNQTPFPLLNRTERKLVQHHILEELTQGFEHRRKALYMVLETKLHSVQEACNHVLVTGKTHLRQQRLEYFGEVFFQVEQRMNGLADSFLKDMDSRFEALNNFKSEAIKQREKQRLEKSVDDFLDTIDQLMDEFRSIISEHINQSDASKQDTQPTPVSTTIEMTEQEYENEFGINDVVDQFMEAKLREKWDKQAES